MLDGCARRKSRPCGEERERKVALWEAGREEKSFCRARRIMTSVILYWFGPTASRSSVIVLGGAAAGVSLVLVQSSKRACATLEAGRDRAQKCLQVHGRVLWDVRSLWADQKVMIQNNFLNKSLYRSYRSLESIASHQSLGMSTLTSAVVPILMERNKKLPPLQAVVPTTVDLDRFQLHPMLPSEFRALFSGTYNDYYDLHLSALFMQELRSQTKLETHWARPKESSKSNIGVGENKVFPSSQTAMAKYIPDYSFGVSICKMDAGPSLAGAMPTKIGEFLACGRPIVVNKGLGDMDRFIEEFNAGVILDGSRINLLESAAKLANLLSDSETPRRCRALAEKYFSMDVGAGKYLDIYDRITTLG